jgi:heme o synthase
MLNPATSASLPATSSRFVRTAAALRAEGTLRALVALTKPRLAVMSVLTTMVAFCAARPAWDAGGAIALLVGTLLSACGALALNQWSERDSDCIMVRTRERPLPSGQLAPSLALLWSSALATTGVVLLAVGVNVVAALVSAATIVSYVFVYTPLKRRTRWATEVGAIPGALPPLIGWAAAEGTLTLFGWLLFALLFFWQMPHFFAIGWVCRHDYRAAGFPLLPAIDESGARTAGWSFAHTVALLVVSVVPWALGLAGALYGVTALLCGAWMLARAWRFVRAGEDRDAAARKLFLASLGYLPLVLIALVIDRMI